MPALPASLQALVALDTLKTWSLIVTLFGDLSGPELSGTQIRTLLGHIGIKPEAIRVALHRLKSDGWITASKRGREASYQMSERARAETASVAPNIYRPEHPYAGGWRFHLFQDGAAPEKNALQIGKNLALLPEDAQPSGKTLVLTPQDTPLPDWIATHLAPDHQVALAARLVSLIGSYDALSSPADRMVFRLLVLHHWRRIALRPGSWAHASFFPGGAIAQCHAQVTKFLDASRSVRSYI